MEKHYRRYRRRYSLLKGVSEVLTAGLYVISRLTRLNAFSFNLQPDVSCPLRHPFEVASQCKNAVIRLHVIKSPAGGVEIDKKSYLQVF